MWYNTCVTLLWCLNVISIMCSLRRLYWSSIKYYGNHSKCIHFHLFKTYFLSGFYVFHWNDILDLALISLKRTGIHNDTNTLRGKGYKWINIRMKLHWMCVCRLRKANLIETKDDSRCLRRKRSCSIWCEKTYKKLCVVRVYRTYKFNALSKNILFMSVIPRKTSYLFV